MTKTRYLLNHRSKFQANRKIKNLTDEDFFYTWGREFDHIKFAEPDNYHKLFDSLDMLKQEIADDPDRHKYGHRIYKITLLEETSTDIAYEPAKVKQPA